MFEKRKKSLGAKCGKYGGCDNNLNYNSCTSVSATAQVCMHTFPGGKFGFIPVFTNGTVQHQL